MTGNPPKCLQAALDYAARGWPVVPIHWPEGDKCSCGKPDCQSPAKHPTTIHGLKDATTDKKVIAAWWQKWPNANVAILTGKESGIMVVDIDPRNGGDVSLKKLERLGNFPITPTAFTGGGGLHFILAHPGNGTRIGNKSKLAGYDGIDFKGDGGYILAVPSKHISGGKYTWKYPHIGTKVVSPPPWLKKIIESEVVRQPLPRGRSSNPWAAMWQGVPDGERNQTAAKLAGRLLGRGLEEEEVTEILTIWDSQNIPPLTDSIIRSTVQSISRKEQQKPTTIGVMPAEYLLSSIIDRPPEIVAHGVLMEASGLILTGESGVGKSLLSLEIAVKLSKGLGLWGYDVDRPRKILFIQKENPDYTVQTRLRRIMRGLSVNHVPNIQLVDRKFRADIGNARDLQKITDLIQKAGAEIVILDPLSSYHHANENDNMAMRRVLDNLTEISAATNVAWIVVHHEGKPSEDRQGKWRFRGASSIRDWADTMIGLIHKSNNEKKTLRLLNFDKLRHGPEHPSLLLERDANFCHHEAQENSLMPMSLVSELLSDIGGKCKGKAPLAKKLMDFTSCGRSSAYRAIEAAEGRTIILSGEYYTVLGKI
ncbi:MAG: bifunctional DNA primase/polymerase [Proteobacteria bacterium]|nr:bifunctional DNA primase/polymerase [Pseudomonadota bacterium]